MGGGIQGKGVGGDRGGGGGGGQGGSLPNQPGQGRAYKEGLISLNIGIERLHPKRSTSYPKGKKYTSCPTNQ